MRGKYSQIIIIVLGLLIVAGVGYAWTNRLSEQKEVRQAVDTSDWKTYLDKEYGLSFKYPQDWSLTQSPHKLLELTPKDKITGSAKNPQIGEKIAITLGSSEPLESVLEIEYGMKPENLVPEYLTIDGHRAIKTKFNLVTRDLGITLGINQGNVNHFFTADINKQRSDADRHTFNAILDSVRLE